MATEYLTNDTDLTAVADAIRAKMAAGQNAVDTEMAKLISRSISGVYSNPLVTSVENHAFAYCSRLTGVILLNCTRVSNQAFDTCSALTTFDVPNTTVIGQYGLRGAAVETLDFSAMERILAYAFSGCTKLTTLILRKTDALATLAAANCFNNTPIASGTGYIYVSNALVDQYKAADNWSTFAAQIKPLSELET